jgi:[ribosomal protein S5]-alanine N-acetyltransferase
MLTSAVDVTPGVVMRPTAPDDALELCRAYVRNRDHLRPWEPRRSPEFFTLAGQAAHLRDRLEQRQAQRLVPWVLAQGTRIVGSVTLSNVSMGVFRGANLGYWIDAEYVGRGLATAAVKLACRAADREVGLHRLEAGTLVHNVRSQRVLAKCGFEPIGTARRYLHIDGAWRDHMLFQVLLNDRVPM